MVRQMLPESIDTNQSLLESDNTQLNLIRWMHQCELMKRYYQAKVVFVIQQTHQGFEIIVSSVCQSDQFSAGIQFPKEQRLFQHLSKAAPDGLCITLKHDTNVELPELFIGGKNLLTRPLLWPDGKRFGCICVLDSQLETDDINLFMLEPFQVLLQQELALYCQTQRIESLSMRDRETGMLNKYGFIMMAPRQLSLGRRFGAHAGLLAFKLCPTPGQPIIEDKHNRLLGHVIQDEIRTADIASHYKDSQFIVLVFVDSEIHLHHIIKRVARSVNKRHPSLKVDASCQYFTPDSNIKLAPMIEQTLAELANNPD